MGYTVEATVAILIVGIVSSGISVLFNNGVVTFVISIVTLGLSVAILLSAARGIAEDVRRNRKTIETIAEGVVDSEESRMKMEKIAREVIEEDRNQK